MTCLDEILGFLNRKPKEISVAVLPDFFLDRLVSLNCEPSQFSSLIERVAGHKGGSIDGISQTDFLGGNAINTASGLAEFGAKITPIVCTNQFGEKLLRLRLKGHNIDFSHIKLKPMASLTTALEFKTESGKTNMMLRDVGSLSDFGLEEDLTSDDYHSIQEADYVCLFNWAGTRKHGTKLAANVFGKMKGEGKGKTYYDTADPRPNIESIPELLEKVLKTPKVDILCVNENEAITFAKYLGEKHFVESKTSFSELALDSARILARFLPARIDLHTTDFSATLTRKKETIIPAFDITPLRATGAGDAWNAGNILADANELTDECRLTLANAVSACYLSDPEGLRPTRQRLTKFLKNSHLPQSKT